MANQDLVRLEERIRTLRGVQVILDADLAVVYGAPTRALNQAVRRNRARFPADFAFQLSSEEWGALRSQIVISKPGRGGRRHSAWAFTEHGAIMAASVLNTSQAVEMSVFVVRAFVRLKGLTRGHAALAARLAALERRVVGHDADLKAVFAALRAIVEPPKNAGRPIGFRGK
jgi:phosphoenolpyruvate-protein kinase (PTS system EI component)